MTSKRPKPLFKVAAEFNVATQSIVDTLSENGFDSANRPNFKITPEMYSALDEVYGEDKAKSADHEKAREEYESRRSQMMNQRNDSVTLENVLEPIEETVGLEPEDETSGLEPEDEDALEPLEPEDQAAEKEESEAEKEEAEKKKAEEEKKKEQAKEKEKVKPKKKKLPKKRKQKN